MATTEFGNKPKLEQPVINTGNTENNKKIDLNKEHIKPAETDRTSELKNIMEQKQKEKDKGLLGS